MGNSEARKLFDQLLNCEKEEEVIRILEKAGYWGDPDVWRYYGDRESNYNTAGNQQSRSDAALVEKLINSIDARLINECLEKGLDPESEQAPQSIRAAVAEFFDDGAKSSTAGLIREWPSEKRNQIGRGISLAATGSKPGQGNPCFTIVDVGEGQTPDAFPRTLVSLDRENKVKIPFVQGKFNMGGTGVLEFCGTQSLQLILSKRNPKLLESKSGTRDHQWGFTVVRREDPVGKRKSSVYSFLAPIGAHEQPRKGKVLAFTEDELSLFPEGNNPYKRSTNWGTLIKLYEYSTVGFSGTHVLRKDGLLRQLDLLLNHLALPIRVHECRQYEGKKGSFDTNLNGISVRLEDDKAGNLETEPFSFSIRVKDETITGTIYVFQKGKHENYKSNEGILFSVNGQWHGGLTKDFFRRSNVGMGILRNSILVMLDCSGMSRRSQEQLFMPSRDRLREGMLLSEIEVELSLFISTDSSLRSIREKRIREEKEALLENDRPLEQLLQELINKSPTLSRLFIAGARLSNPFRTEGGGEGEGNKPLVTKKFPTFFKLIDSKDGKFVERECYVNKRPRIFFETDAENSYLDRAVQPGKFSIKGFVGQSQLDPRFTINIYKGIATLNVFLPEDLKPGDTLVLETNVTDETQINAFEARIVLHIKGDGSKTKGGSGGRRRDPKNGQGKNQTSGGLALPTVFKVSRDGSGADKSWEDMDPVFDENSALRLVGTGAGNETGEKTDSFLFYVNVDNIHLKTELKMSKTDPELLQTRYIYAQTLLGLAFVNYAKTSKADSIIEDDAEKFSIAISPVLLPMIEGLGELEVNEESALA